MFVWVVLARRPGEELYVLAVFAAEEYAHEQAARYLRQNPAAEVSVQRFWVID